MRALYYDTPERVAALGSELAEWRGTRFFPRAGQRGRRADCIRFAVAVHQATGAIARPVVWPLYSVRQWPGAYDAIVSRYLAQGNWEVIDGASCTFAAGDVPIARLDDGSIHTGVIESARVAWHCFPHTGVTQCHPSGNHVIAVLRAYEH